MSAFAVSSVDVQYPATLPRLQPEFLAHAIHGCGFVESAWLPGARRYGEAWGCKQNERHRARQAVSSFASTGVNVPPTFTNVPVVRAGNCRRTDDIAKCP
jgi:hypothetical protein